MTATIHSFAEYRRLRRQRDLLGSHDPPRPGDHDKPFEPAIADYLDRYSPPVANYAETMSAGGTTSRKMSGCLPAIRG
jgi:hypothetical protein